MTKTKKTVTLALTALAVLFLLGAGYSVIYVREYLREDPVAYARAERWADAIRVLEKHPWWVRRVDAEGRNALHYAEDEVLASLLLAKGVSPNCTDIYGFTPLHTVANPKVVERLLEGGANPNAQSNTCRYAPLHTTVNFLCLDGKTDYLVKGAPNQEARYVFQRPKHGDVIAKVQLLLSHKAEVNIQALHKETPLDLASGLDEEVQDLLTRNGGKINTWDSWKKHRPDHD